MKCHPHHNAWATMFPHESARGHIIRCPACPWRDRAEGVAMALTGWEPCDLLWHMAVPWPEMRRRIRVWLRDAKVTYVRVGQEPCVVDCCASFSIEITKRLSMNGTHAIAFNLHTTSGWYAHVVGLKTSNGIDLVYLGSQGDTPSDDVAHHQHSWWVQRELRRAVNRAKHQQEERCL